jgi:hypothetical protein
MPFLLGRCREDWWPFARPASNRALVERRLRRHSGRQDPGRRGRALAAVSSFFTEAFGVTIKVLGDQTGNNRLVTSGSLRERDL